MGSHCAGTQGSGQSLSGPAGVRRMMVKPVLVLALLHTSSALNFGRTENDISEKCVDFVGEGRNPQSRFSMPLAQLGEKKYYLGIFFKANWYKAEQYCRFHGMHLASINSAEEQDNLEDHIQSFGMGHEHFWASGTDQAEEGKFFWMSTGKPVTYENWNAGEPNNFQYEMGNKNIVWSCGTGMERVSDGMIHHVPLKLSSFVKFK